MEVARSALDLYEVDRSERWNRATPAEFDGEGYFVVHQGDGEYHTIGWICQTCLKSVTLPEGIDTEWT